MRCILEKESEHMYGKGKERNLTHNRGAMRAKGGFTLIELVIVMAVMAILAATVVSFSVLMKGYAEKSENQYSFLTQCSTLKASVTEWVAENDEEGAVFTVHTNGTLSVTKGGETSTLRFSSGCLYQDGKKTVELTLIKSATFSLKGELVRCDVSAAFENGPKDKNFVFSLRAAALTKEGGE